MRNKGFGLTLTLVALLVCGVAVSVFAEQDTTITVREVRNPRTLRDHLNNNATDAESRMTSGSSTSSLLPLINFNDAGTASVTLQADRADDAGDKYGIQATDGSGLAIQSDISAKGTLATKVTISNVGGIAAADAITLTDASGHAVISAVAKTGAYDAKLILDADAGDDTNDTWTIESEAADNDLSFVNGTTEAMKITTAGAMTINGSLTVTNAATFTGAATASSTLAVVGVGTFTAESVHNLGVDADYITTDGGASGGIDTKSAATLTVGESTASRVEIGDTAIVVEAEGPLHATEFVLSDEVDALTATTLSIGKATATKLEVADTAVTTEVQGPLTVLGSTGAGLDAMGATALFIGEATATSVSLAATLIETDVMGTLSVDEAAVFDSTVTLTGVATLTEAPVFTDIEAGTAVTVAMTNAPACVEETPIWLTVTYNGTNYYVPAWQDQ